MRTQVEECLNADVSLVPKQITDEIEFLSTLPCEGSPQDFRSLVFEYYAARTLRPNLIYRRYLVADIQLGLEHALPGMNTDKITRWLVNAYLRNDYVPHEYAHSRFRRRFSNLCQDPDASDEERKTMFIDYMLYRTGEIQEEDRPEFGRPRR